MNPQNNNFSTNYRFSSPNGNIQGVGHISVFNTAAMNAINASQNAINASLNAADASFNASMASLNASMNQPIQQPWMTMTPLPALDFGLPTPLNPMQAGYMHPVTQPQQQQPMLATPPSAQLTLLPAAADDSDSTKEKKTNEKCAICLINPKTVVIIPCRHLCLCRRCCVLHRPMTHCPICKITIQDAFEIKH